ncbi:MAG: flagellar biosynthetic protein FliO [Nitrospina sp.]|nr:flagellar biosynthetic protein FliO [Nitrospina sp.]
MNFKKSWILLVSLFVFLSPLCLEAKVSLKHMNLLKSIDTQSTEDELTIKLSFKKPLVHLREPLFLKKSIQIDFPLAYSEPAKQFLKIGDSQIKQVYVSQFNSKTMRVRFILNKEDGDLEKKFQMEKDRDFLIVRIVREPTDILGQLLARTTEKIKEKKQINNIKNIDVSSDDKINTESQPLTFEAKKTTSPVEVNKTISPSLNASKVNFPKIIKTADFKEKKKWGADNGNAAKSPSDIKTTSFSIFQSKNKNEQNQVGLVSSSLRMVTTLLLVLGLIFLLFFGFKKYVLKNTAFGGGKMVHILGTSFLAPKKNIALVEVAGEILVLGVSDQNISLLTSISEPRRIEEIKNAHGNNLNNMDSKQGVSKNLKEKTSFASSNAANMFSKYLNQFSDSGSDKQASVDAVTEKIRRHMGKARTA